MPINNLIDKTRLSEFFQGLKTKFVPTTRKINGKELSSDINITANDINIWRDIGAGQDLDTYRTPGNYRCSTTSNAKTILNLPVSDNQKRAFTLIVEESAGGTANVNNVRQKLKFYRATKGSQADDITNEHDVWERTGSTTEWYGWIAAARNWKDVQLDFEIKDGMPNTLSELQNLPAGFYRSESGTNGMATASIAHPHTTSQVTFSDYGAIFTNPVQAGWAQFVLSAYSALGNYSPDAIATRITFATLSPTSPSGTTEEFTGARCKIMSSITPGSGEGSQMLFVMDKLTSASRDGDIYARTKKSGSANWEPWRKISGIAPLTNVTISTAKGLTIEITKRMGVACFNIYGTTNASIATSERIADITDLTFTPSSTGGVRNVVITDGDTSRRVLVYNSGAIVLWGGAISSGKTFCGSASYHTGEEVYNSQVPAAEASALNARITQLEQTLASFDSVTQAQIDEIVGA